MAAQFNSNRDALNALADLAEGQRVEVAGRPARVEHGTIRFNHSDETPRISRPDDGRVYLGHAEVSTQHTTE